MTGFGELIADYVTDTNHTAFNTAPNFHNDYPAAPMARDSSRAPVF
jgi:hypothetical protein